MLSAVGVAVLVGLVGCAARHPQPQVAEPVSRFLIGMWCGPPQAEFNDARAAEIATAGFTTVAPPCEGGTTAAGNVQALAVAARHGLRMWVADDRFTLGVVGTPGWEAGVDAAVAAYREQPGIEAYFIADEPAAADFEKLALLAARIRTADPHHDVYVNVLPDFVPLDGLGAASYEEYVEQYIAAVHPRLLSYDFYPFGEKKDRSTYFRNLDTMRALALRHRLPFMLIVQAMPHGPYRDPTEAELAWQVFHALAFGARGVAYFAYWTPPAVSDKVQFRYGLIEQGKPTLHYFQAARVNRELQAIAGELATFHSFAVADSAGEIGGSFPIGPIVAVDGEKITVGLFASSADDLAALLVNRDYRYGATAVVRLRDGARPPEGFDATAARWRSDGNTSFTLAPGHAQLLRWRAAER